MNYTPVYASNKDKNMQTSSHKEKFTPSYSSSFRDNEGSTLAKSEKKQTVKSFSYMQK